MADRFPDELNALFQAYRTALPDPDPSRDFMPGLWQRIDAKRGRNQRFGILARRFVATSGALAALMALIMAIQSQSLSPVATMTYVEALDSEPAVDVIEIEAQSETL